MQFDKKHANSKGLTGVRTQGRYYRTVNQYLKVFVMMNILKNFL